MKSIGICIVVPDDVKFSQVVYFIENIVFKIKSSNIVIYIYANGCDIETKTYLEQVCNSIISESENPKKVNNFVYSENSINVYEAFNKLFVLVNEDYICSIPFGIIVNDDWYFNLLNCYETINLSGIVSIHTGIDNVYYTSTLSEGENLKTIIKPENEDEPILGIYFIKTSIVRQIGGFDKNLFNTGCETKEICWRYRKNGYINYYVTKQNCIDVSNKNNNDIILYKYEEVIKEKNKNKIYKAQF